MNMSTPIAKRPAPLSDAKARRARNKRFRELGLPYKTCNACFAVKAHSAFSKDKVQADGLTGRCRDCDRAVMVERRAADPDYDRRYYAEHVEERRKYDKRRRDNTERRNLLRSYDAKWTRNNPEKVRASSQRRRARKAEAEYDGHTWADLMRSWDERGLYSCVFCHKPFEHVEHFVPLALGGSHILDNLYPACESCNLSKGARDPYEFLADMFSGSTFADELRPFIGLHKPAESAPNGR
jgi:5-methylcytosine-specific restriction endonuclease McrA